MSRLISLPYNAVKVLSLLTTSSGARSRATISRLSKKASASEWDRGLLAGFPVVDIQIDLYDGKYHPVDSSDMAFQIAGSIAFAAAAEEADACLLEPVMSVDITVPEQFMGSIYRRPERTAWTGHGC